MELNDRLSLCPGEMAGAGGHEGEGARGELLTARLLEFLVTVSLRRDPVSPYQPFRSNSAE